MSIFETQFGRTGAVNLTRQFGESVTYHPDVGDDRTIDYAIVERDGPGLIGEYGTPVYQAVIRVKNDSTTGISATEIDTGGDELSFPLRRGETPVTRKSIVKVLGTDNGLVRFGVQ